jgi:formate dehydrogenase beta subunit
VIARSGFEYFKASPWEKEDAEDEGRDPREPGAEALRHRERQADRHGVREGSSTTPRDAQAAAGGGPIVIPCDDVLLAIGQENAFPWIERDIGIEFDKWDMPVVDKTTFSRRCRACSSAATRRSGPKNIIWAVAHGHEAAISIHNFCRACRHRAPAAGHDLSQQKMGIHEWSYERLLPAQRRSAARDCRIALEDDTEVELGFDAEQTAARRSAASTATCRRCSPTRCASSATPASTSARWTASPSRQRRGGGPARARLKRAGAQPRPRPLYVSDARSRPGA